MTASSQTAPPPPADNPLGFEGNCDNALRAKLGLREIYFPTVEIENAALPHPDESPCPSWCWIAEQDEHRGKVEFGHSVDLEHVTSAHHTMSSSASVRASLYKADYNQHGPVAPGVVAATIEPHLEQVGTDCPFIRIALRQDSSEKYDPDRLRLTTDDARDLVKVLNYLIGLADAEDKR